MHLSDIPQLRSRRGTGRTCFDTYSSKQNIRNLSSSGGPDQTPQHERDRTNQLSQTNHTAKHDHASIRRLLHTRLMVHGTAQCVQY